MRAFVDSLQRLSEHLLGAGHEQRARDVQSAADDARVARLGARQAALDALAGLPPQDWPTLHAAARSDVDD